MAVLDFNAYKLEYLVEGQGYYDGNGDYQPAEDAWVEYGRCNAVPAGRNNVIGLPDGQTIAYSFTIILHEPKCREFKYGERLRLTTVFGCEQVELSVKGFARYQYQAKIWA
jgi:hypothetical protein